MRSRQIEERNEFKVEVHFGRPRTPDGPVKPDKAET